MAVRLGRNCKVCVSGDLVAGMGTWSMDGISVDQIDITAFGDVYKTFVGGMVDGGTITFDGWYDPADTSGQEILRGWNENATEATTLRLYVDNTSFFIPTTTNPLSHVTITSYTISVEKTDVIRSKFTAKVSGKMQLLAA